MKLYLIRHGKTMANEKHLYCGSTNLPLSEKGIEELQNLHYEIHSQVSILKKLLEQRL